MKGKRLPAGEEGKAPADKGISMAASFFAYPSDTTKGSSAIVRALLMATVNSL